MVATASPNDELPTSRFAALPRQSPPPLPRPVLVPIVVPRVLGKATLIIELPIDQLDEQEIAQISFWLRGRASSVVLRRSARERVASAVVSFVRDVRTRALARVKSALTWMLTHLAAETP